MGSQPRLLLLEFYGADVTRRSLGSANAALVFADQSEAGFYETLKMPLTLNCIVKGSETAVGGRDAVQHGAPRFGQTGLTESSVLPQGFQHRGPLVHDIARVAKATRSVGDEVVAE